MATSPRIGVFGGSFDPIHLGHLLLLETAREQLGFDHVVVLPTAVSPWKVDRTVAAAEQRLDMARLATAGNDGAVVSDWEARRAGVSYTVDALRELHDQRPDAALVLLVGSDNLAGLPLWKDAREIVRLAAVAAAGRPGASSEGTTVEEVAPTAAALARRFADVFGAAWTPADAAAVRVHRLQMPAVEISSRDVRARVAAGRSIRYRVPDAVAAYIAEHGLYREST
ncbi:MAG: nicotinate-nucleotide adenylyltransferase [Planctomycetia bacterium]